MAAHMLCEPVYPIELGVVCVAGPEALTSCRQFFKPLLSGVCKMGMFDSVMADCPNCGTKNEFQSKGGACELASYELHEAPAEVLAGAARHPMRCRKCDTAYKIVVQCVVTVTRCEDNWKQRRKIRMAAKKYAEEAVESTPGLSHCSSSRESLIETNRRLNRRCQALESEVNRLRRDVGAAINEMRDNSRTANRYASRLRTLAKHHENVRHPWYPKCWVCRFRRWRRARIWNRYFKCE